eukprot:scaffold160177_cov25-Tisochrysis_lutea.AAC.2
MEAAALPTRQKFPTIMNSRFRVLSAQQPPPHQAGHFPGSSLALERAHNFLILRSGIMNVCRDTASPRPSSRHLIGLDASLVTPGSGEGAKQDDDLGAIVGRGSVMGPLPAYSQLAELARSVASVKVTDGQVRLAFSKMQPVFVLRGVQGCNAL